jgi:hypothetical protein
MQKTYIIIGFVFFFIFLLAVLLKKHNFMENMGGESKFWFITFGGPSENWHQAVERVKNDVDGLQIFDHIMGYTDLDLKTDPEFWNIHGEMAERETGFGLWIWKPYLILRTMKLMNYGDVLLYYDAGCTLKDSTSDYKTRQEDMFKLLKRAQKNDIVFSSTFQLERHYSKMDLVEHLEMNSPDVLNSIQAQAGILFIKKTHTTINLLTEWYNTMHNYSLCDDSGSKYHVDAYDYHDSRRDQSVFSLLVKKHGLYYGNMLEKDDELLPILISRRRGA